MGFFIDSFNHPYCLHLLRGVYSVHALPGVPGPTGKRVSRDIQGCVAYSHLIFIHVKELQVQEGDQMAVY